MPRPPSRRTSFRSVRDARTAGRRPTTSPVPSATTAMYEKTRQSNGRSNRIGRSAGSLMPDSRTLSQRPMNAPARPPAPASIRLSVSICRTRRRRPAPSAARSASSRRRTVARTISRFTTFTHATSRTSATSSRNTPATSGLLFAALGSGRARRSGIARARTVLFVSGYCCSSCRASTSSAACACASGTPGFSLPTTRSPWLSRCSTVSL